MPPALILDTNVVLDWLVFANPAALPIEAALRAGQARWLVTPAMREELDRVLAYTAIAAWKPDRARIDAAFDAWASLERPSAARLDAPRCTDTDDQKFIDLALSVHARWLLTRDRAVLRLAKRARPLGVSIIVPERFSP